MIHCIGFFRRNISASSNMKNYLNMFENEPTMGSPQVKLGILLVQALIFIQNKF